MNLFQRYFALSLFAPGSIARLGRFAHKTPSHRIEPTRRRVLAARTLSLCRRKAFRVKLARPKPAGTPAEAKELLFLLRSSQSAAEALWKKICTFLLLPTAQRLYLLSSRS